MIVHLTRYNVIMSVAWFISRLFDPIVLLIFLVISGSIKSGLPAPALSQFLIIFLLFVVLPPVVLMFWGVKNKKISDWDVSNRTQRVKVLLIFTSLFALDMLIFKNFGNQFIFTLYRQIFLWLLGFLTITFFWKISGHMAAVTLAALWLSGWYGPLFWLWALFIPIVAWARLIQKKHTPAEIAGGVIYSLIFYSIFIRG